MSFIHVFTVGGGGGVDSGFTDAGGAVFTVGGVDSGFTETVAEGARGGRRGGEDCCC